MESKDLVTCYRLVRENSIIANTNSISRQESPGAMKQGTLQLVSPTGEVLGTYNFRNGGGGRGYIPQGNYIVGPEEPLTDKDRRAMTVGRSGWKFRILNSSGGRLIPDPRVEHIRTSGNPQGGPRDGILIHPDGGGPGTNGCIGIVGDEKTQEDFRNKLNALIKQNGGKYSLNFDTGKSVQATAALPQPSSQPDSAAQEPTTPGQGATPQGIQTTKGLRLDTPRVQPAPTQTSNKINTYKQFVQTRKQLSGRGY